MNTQKTTWTLLVLLLLCLGEHTVAHAAEFWTDNKTTNRLIVGTNVLLLADWSQTREIADNPRYIETNPVLGETPTSGDVNRYFMKSLLVTNLTGYVLPEKYKKLFYGTVTTFQISVVAHNLSAGVSFSF